MRLDKFLKVSRVIKRRTVANEACDAGRVKINDRPAKASAEVKVGDIIEVQFGSRPVKIQVLDIQDTTKKEEAGERLKHLEAAKSALPVLILSLPAYNDGKRQVCDLRPGG